MNFQVPLAQPAGWCLIQTRAISCISTSTMANYSTISECRMGPPSNTCCFALVSRGSLPFLFLLHADFQEEQSCPSSTVTCTSTNQIQTSEKPQEEMPSPWHYWPKGQCHHALCLIVYSPYKINWSCLSNGPPTALKINHKEAERLDSGIWINKFRTPK